MVGFQVPLASGKQSAANADEEDEELALAKRERHLDRLERAAHARTQTLVSMALGLGAERSELALRMQAMVDAGVLEARQLMDCLPEVPVQGAWEAQHTAMMVRRQTIQSRETMLDHIQRASDELMDSMARMRWVLGQMDGRIKALATTPPKPPAPSSDEATAQSLEEALSAATDAAEVAEKDTPEAAAAEVVVAPQPAAAERRTAPRVQLSCEVGLDTETNFYSGFAWDLSSGGLFVTCFDHMEIGQEVDISFVLPDGTRVAASCQVRWVREHDGSGSHVLPGVGLQFASIDPEAQRAIEGFVQQREPMFYPD